MKKTDETILQLTRQKMQELREQRARELSEIDNLQAQERERLALAEVNAKEASEALNLEAFEQSKEEMKRAETALQMYMAREEQLLKKEYITEAESDNVIDSLLAYEEHLNNTLRIEIRGHLNALEDLLKTYQTEIHKIEATITEWTSEIHANYRSRGITLYYEEGTHIPTDRSNTPIPVHRVTYTGSTEAQLLEDYLQKANRVRI